MAKALSTTTHATLEFTEDDGALFAVTDAQLKADALKQDVLPRLGMLLERGLAKVQEIYGVEPMEHNNITALPGFRPSRRKEPVKHHYTSAAQGLTGSRTIVWKGVERPDGKPAKIMPHRYVFLLDQEGIRVGIYHWWQQYTPATNKKFARFILQQGDHVFQLMRLAGLGMTHHYIDVCSLEAALYHEAEAGMTPAFWSRPIPFPVHGKHLEQLVECYAMLYPIYESYLRIAMGRKPIFTELVARLEHYLIEDGDRLIEVFGSQQDPTAEVDLEEVLRKADQRVTVPHGRRWQVLSRDGWRCLSCGKTSFRHHVVLHVDHKVPRSLGGSDDLDNLQTLCEACNLGKSNRDSTDLRKLAKQVRGEE
ncbi:MAG TPA: HNH endonuclease [Flavobacteriales bacterium]|nr:HNH endonuclease [Flavobacteriales bacterium]MCB0787081.1 HNH endonuclease [Flavobacteriales bacterium]MCB0809864.1 HNH endonuclease [Flavobacteriales bacterium]MCB0814360.1 HNH endonuclease [Flavobacteriales bacterium]HOP44496.1 HNH endonuclease [Flavobacteriales bacterium]